MNPGRPYKDAGSIKNYAGSGVQLCYQMGIMSGGSDGTFNPQAATRAEVAVTMVQMARVMAGKTRYSGRSKAGPDGSPSGPFRWTRESTGRLFPLKQNTTGTGQSFF